jgi:GGDEF domain-containing protein
MAANFVVVLPETDGLAAMTIAERLRTLFAAVKTLAPSGETILCTVSIGISVCQSGG